MKFTIHVGQNESQVDFRRQPWSGYVRISVDGRTIVERSGPAIWFGLTPVRRYEFHAGSHDVRVEHERPLLFAGFRPHDYRVFVDGQMIHKQHGY